MRLPYFRWILLSEYKGALIFTGILALWILLVAAVFPSFSETFSNPLTEVDGITLEELEEGGYNLTWKPNGEYQYHAAIGTDDEEVYQELVGLGSHIPGFNATRMLENESYRGEIMEVLDLHLLYFGRELGIRFNDTGGSVYFGVLYLDEEGGMKLSNYIDINNLTVQNPFKEYMEGNAMIEGMVGDSTMVDMGSYDGFMLLEFMQMWPLLIGIYAGIKGVSFVSKHIDDHSMDVLLATGYRRRRFLLEKLMSSVLLLLAISALSYLLIGMGSLMLGEPFSWGRYALAFAASLPYILAALSIGILISTMGDDHRRTIWTVLGVIMMQYLLYIIANLVDTLEWIGYLTIFGYWDSIEIVVGPGASLIDTAILLAASVVLLGVSLYWFERRDLPA